MTKKTITDNTSLESLRDEIDQLDHALIKLLSQRMNVVVQVGQWKKNHGVVPLDNDRWQKVLDSRKALAIQNNLNSHFVETIFEAIHHQALEIEHEKCL
jgi:chorismate mutase